MNVTSHLRISRLSAGLRPSQAFRAHCQAPGRDRRRLTTVAASGAEGGRASWDFGRFLQTLFFFNAPRFGGMSAPGAAPATAAAAGGVVFAADGSGAVQDFGSLDDVVMGGASSSAFSLRQQAGERGGPAGAFSGNVTTANNGGFSSVRCRNLSPPLDLSGSKGLELRVKGDGQRYKLIVRTDSGWDTAGYTRGFDTKPGVWQTVRLPFSEMKAVFRARTVVGALPLDPASFVSLQLMLSKFEADGKLNPSFNPGSFELLVERIAAYK